MKKFLVKSIPTEQNQERFERYTLEEAVENLTAFLNDEIRFKRHKYKKKKEKRRLSHRKDISTMNKDFIEIVKAAQSREDGSFEKLYEVYFNQVYFLALRITRNNENAEEITQDVFLYVYQKLADLKDPQAFPMWLKKITSNKCVDFMRKNSVRASDVEEIAESEFIEETNPELIPDKAFDNLATAEIIIGIIDNLPLPQRICVYCYYYEQLSVKEIAERLAIKETTVKNRLALARDKIRKELEKLEDEEGLKLYNFFPLILLPLIETAIKSFQAPPDAMSKILTVITNGTTVTITTSTTGTATATTTSTAGTVTTTTASTAGTATVTAVKIGFGIKAAIAVIASIAAVSAIVVGVSVFTQPEGEPYVEETRRPRASVEENYENEPNDNNSDVIDALVELNDEISEETSEETNDKMIIDETDIPEFITIKGKQYSTDLERLYLSFMELTDLDIEPLKYMTNLTSLQLTENNITDITLLQYLTNLTYLELSENNITDITPLQYLTNLTHLELDENNITDITPLQYITNLKSLELSGNNVADITPLQHMVNLEYLWLENNNITDITPLKYMTNLKSLKLSNNNIIDITPLSDIIASDYWEDLCLDRNQIIDITPLSNANWIMHDLDLSHNQIDDISALKGLRVSGRLALYSNPVTDFTPLFELNRPVDESLSISLPAHADSNLNEELAAALSIRPSDIKRHDYPF